MDMGARLDCGNKQERRDAGQYNVVIGHTRHKRKQKDKLVYLGLVKSLEDNFVEVGISAASQKSVQL